MTVLFSFRVVLLGLLTLGCLAHAQVPSTADSPSAAQMIEQLKTPAAAPRTRSLRNLGVEATDAQGAVASRPSLSLHIQFDFDSARVRPESQQALSNLALALQSPELLLAKFAIEGHTDAKGRADYNLKLSQLRADAVREYLGQHGVAVERLQPSGKGASDLVNPHDPNAAENRRVRIVNVND